MKSKKQHFKRISFNEKHNSKKERWVYGKEFIGDKFIKKKKYNHGAFGKCKNVFA